MIKEKIRQFFLSVYNKLKEYVLSKDTSGNYKILGSVRFYLLIAFLVEFIIECACRHSVKSAVVFMLISFYVFAFNVLIIFVTMLPALFVKRKVFYLALIDLIWLGLGIGCGVVTTFRVTPLSMIDFLNLPSVFPIISIYLNVWQIILISAAILAAIALVVVLFIKAPKNSVALKKGIVTAAVSVVLIPVSYTFGLATDMLSDNFTSLTIAYDSYGFPYCFAVSVIDRGVSTPHDYSENMMDEILEGIDSCDDSQPENKPNVIYLQLESFFDVNRLVNVQFSENPIPNFTELCENSISGNLMVPVIGAGTVNTEFEVLTGMSLDYFGTGEYPYKTELLTYTCESAAYNLKELGYNAHAIHNYQGTFYQRNLVYSNLGFDTFTSLEYMQDVEYNVSGTWPTDMMLVDSIFDALDSTEGSDFIMAVSVQGHGKYPPNELPEGYEYNITAEFIDGTIEGGLSDINALMYYVNQLHEMDAFIKALVDAVKAYDEDTVLVMYGDHLPSLSIENSDLSDQTVYETTYVIVSNFGVEEGIDTLGDLYSYQLSANAMKLIGVHNGILTKLHQNYSDKEYYREWLHELEYDMLGSDVLGRTSERYVYGGNMEYYPKTELKMGVKDIIVEATELSDGTLYIYGENFTQWSVPIVNGQHIDEFTYVDSKTIMLPYDSSASINSVCVAQMTDKSAELSSSNEIVYEYTVTQQ